MAAPSLRNLGCSVLDHVYSQVAACAAHLAIAFREMVEPSGAPEPKKCDFVEIDIPAELRRRPTASDVGASLHPHQDLVNSFSKGSPE